MSEPFPPTDTPLDPSQTDSRVYAAFQEYLACAEAGNAPDRAAFLARYPDLAGQLSGCLAVLDIVQAATSAAPPLSDFRLLREIGRGGMGVVYEAEQLSLGRRVAVKVLPAASALDPRRLRRFRAEAQAAAQTRHPHVVPVYAVGCEGGVYYQVMALIDGVNLADLVACLRAPANGPPPVHGLTGPDRYRTAARLAVQAADALDHAHAVGVVHRDIKPANLLIEPSGHLWVADFGLAKLTGVDDLTRTREVVGTLRYMSPEQAVGQPTDHRTDVYGLGVTLYELLTLTRAFPGEEPQDVLRRVTTSDPPRPRRIDPAIPYDLETIVLTAMARAPEERYATARALADDLTRYLEDRPLLARRPPPITRARAWARRNRTRLAWVTGAMMAALVVAVIGLSVANDRIRTEQATSAEANVRLGAALAEQQAATAREARARDDATRARDRERDTAYLYRYAQAWREYENGNPRQCRALLDACPPEPRGWEWVYLDAVCRPSAVRTFPHAQHPAAVSFTPDGRRFAHGSEVWDVTTGARVRRVTIEKKWDVHSSTLTPDGRYLILVTGANRIVQLTTTQSSPPGTAECRVIDVESGAIVSRFGFPVPASAVVTVTTDAQGRRVAVAAGDRVARLFDVKTGKPAGEIEANGTVGRVVFHPDGTTVAAVVEGVGVAIWDVAARAPRQMAPDPVRRLRSVTFSADGRALLWTAPDRVVRVWDLARGRERLRFVEHTRAIPTTTAGGVLAVSPKGGWVASALDDGVVRVWDVETGRPAHVFREHALGVLSLAFANDGRDLVAVFRDRVAVWEVEPRDQAPTRSMVARSVGQTSADARRVVRTIAAGTRVQVAEVHTGRVIAEWPGGPNQTYQFGDDSGRYLFVHDAVAPAIPIGRNPAAGGAPFSVTLSSLATGGRTVLWDTDTGRSLAAVDRSRDRVSWFALAADGSSFIQAAGSEVTVRTSAGGAILAQVRARRPVASVVAVAPAGRRVAYGTTDAVVTVHTTPAGPVHALREHTALLAALAFSPDGDRLVTASRDGTACVWDAVTGRLLVSFDRHTNAVDAIGWSADGQRIASGGADRSVRVWDGQTGQELLAFTDLPANVQRVAFSADGRQLVAHLLSGESVAWGRPVGGESNTARVK